MIKKIKTTLSLVSENIFIKYYTAQEKIKNFSTPVFDSTKKERGIVISGTTLLIGAAIALGGAIWGYTKVKGDIGEAGQGFFASLVMGLGMFLVSIANALFNLAADFLKYVLRPSFINQTITGNTTFVTIWASVRDIANMFIVLGFVVVGIATSLRFGEYGAKKLLPFLIIIAILINFSGLFCGLIIDASNITMNTLLQDGKTNESFTALSTAINNYVENQLSDIKINSGTDLDVGGNN